MLIFSLRPSVYFPTWTSWAELGDHAAAAFVCVHGAHDNHIYFILSLFKRVYI